MTTISADGSGGGDCIGDGRAFAPGPMSKRPLRNDEWDASGASDRVGESASSATPPAIATTCDDKAGGGGDGSNQAPDVISQPQYRAVEGLRDIPPVWYTPVPNSSPTPNPVTIHSKY